MADMYCKLCGGKVRREQTEKAVKLVSDSERQLERMRKVVKHYQKLMGRMASVVQTLASHHAAAQATGADPRFRLPLSTLKRAYDLCDHRGGTPYVVRSNPRKD